MAENKKPLTSAFIAHINSPERQADIACMDALRKTSGIAVQNKQEFLRFETVKAVEAVYEPEQAKTILKTTKGMTKNLKQVLDLA